MTGLHIALTDPGRPALLGPWYADDDSVPPRWGADRRRTDGSEADPRAAYRAVRRSMRSREAAAV